MHFTFIIFIKDIFSKKFISSSNIKTSSCSRMVLDSERAWVFYEKLIRLLMFDWMFLAKKSNLELWWWNIEEGKKVLLKRLWSFLCWSSLKGFVSSDFGRIWRIYIERELEDLEKICMALKRCFLRWSRPNFCF